MVDVLVILDGASEPLGSAPTSLEQARTPVLDRLAASGELRRLRTVAPPLPAGSETAIPALLGWTPPAPVDRGAVEAAAYGFSVLPGERAWRVDVVDRDGARAGEQATRRAMTELRALAPRHTVGPLARHRLLVVGPAPLPAVARRPGLQPWREGVVPPAALDPETTVVAARGAAAGIARLMGARVIVPPGATGRPDSDLEAKASFAIEAIDGGAAHVVVHVGGADEAAHARDRAAKVATIERADRDVIGPLAEAVRLAGGKLRVCPDHGCDPHTGEHDASPVPCVDWRPESRTVQPSSGRRMIERAVVALPECKLASEPSRRDCLEVVA